MAATKTDKGSRQDMFANSVNSLMGSSKDSGKKEEKPASKVFKAEDVNPKGAVAADQLSDTYPVVAGDEKHSPMPGGTGASGPSPEPGAASVPQDTQVPGKRKAPGRPKGVEKTQISLYLPNELLSKMECATFFYKGNVTAYITSLIEKDMEANKERYDNIRSAMDM